MWWPKWLLLPLEFKLEDVFLELEELWGEVLFRMLWVLEVNEFTDKHIGERPVDADGVKDGVANEDDDVDDGDACRLFITKVECDGDGSGLGIPVPFKPVYLYIYILGYKNLDN